MDFNEAFLLFSNWMSSWQIVLAAYLVLFLIIYRHRKKFQFQSKIVMMLHTKIGLKLMHYLGDKHAKFFRVLGFVGIFVGYIGMVFMTGIILFGVYQLIFVPDAAPVVSPVLPGVSIPGSPISVPFWSGMIALFITIVVHEFGHGVISVANKIKVKSSGFVMFGPIPGAFVEPDEKQLEKATPSVKLAVFAAGPWFNALLAMFIFLLLLVIVNPLIGNATTEGVAFSSLLAGTPAANSSLETDVVYKEVDGVTMVTYQTFFEYMQNTTPGQVITFSNERNTVSVELGTHPQNPDLGYLGVIPHQVTLKESLPGWLGIVLLWMYGLLGWIFILSIGIGSANLLPLGPVDGGRMFEVALQKFFKKKLAGKIWSKTALILFIVIIVLVVIPIIKAVLFS
ncbi:MAG: site-2 protease family protein [Candidatus Woesearchaeota archaeon]|nr:MAG: site-2 protease family protein [Candidatus Woesearchaeota archaeon]